MIFPELLQGTVIKRYKRFFTDLRLDNGEFVTAHTPNTGSMKSCLEPGWKALISPANNPKRKLKYTLEFTHNGSTWIGVNTSLTNKLVAEALHHQVIPELTGYSEILSEQKRGESRLDFLLKSSVINEPDCYVEVKNVTLAQEDTASFPDTVSVRAQKHLQELIRIKQVGQRSVLFLLVQRSDISRFTPAAWIDPKYAELFFQAQQAGVEILAYQTHFQGRKVEIRQKLSLHKS